MPQPAPTRVGRYQLLAPIARGGTATVYLGRAQGLGGFSRIVAIKLLHPHLLDDAASRVAHEFVEEAKLSALLQHPMIVPVIDVGKADEGFYLVMDYVDGASLAEIMACDTPLPQRIAVRILNDVLQGLHAAHSARDEKGRPLEIVHRDYSPQNILIGADGRGKITDFGIARATTRAEYTRTGLVKGKVAYMSPEQGEGRKLDPRTDVWAAGVVAWEMFAGQRMYPDLDPMPMLLRITTGEPPRLKSANPNVSDALDDAVHSALVRDRERRLGSALQLRDAIVEATGGKTQIASDEEVSQFIEGLKIERLIRLRALVQEVTQTDMASNAIVARPGRGHAFSEAETQLEAAAQTRPLVPLAEMPTAAMSGAGEPTSMTHSMSHSSHSGLRAWLKKRTVIVGLIATLALATTGFVLSGAFAPRRGTGAELGSTQLLERTSDERAGSADEARGETTADTPNPDGADAESDALELSDLPEETARDELDVTANEPINSIRIGKRAVVLADPSSELTLHLTTEEQKGPLVVEATARDGRKASGVAEAGETTLALRFPPRRMTTKPRATGPVDEPSDLEASPY